MSTGSYDIIPKKDHMVMYLIQYVVTRQKLASVHSHGVKMATELHHLEDRRGRVASVPEAPGICHVTVACGV
jgi:hypothetical protein